MTQLHSRKGTITVSTGDKFSPSFRLPFVDTSSGVITADTIMIPLWSIANALQIENNNAKIILNQAKVTFKAVAAVKLYFSQLHGQYHAVSCSNCAKLLKTFSEVARTDSDTLKRAKTIAQQLSSPSFIAAAIHEIQHRATGQAHISAGAQSGNVFINCCSFKPIEVASFELPYQSKKYKDNPIKLREPWSDRAPTAPIVSRLGFNSFTLRGSNPKTKAAKARCTRRATLIKQILDGKQ